MTAYRAFHSKLSLLYDSSVLFFIIGENPVKNQGGILVEQTEK